MRGQANPRSLLLLVVRLLLVFQLLRARAQSFQESGRIDRNARGDQRRDRLEDRLDPAALAITDLAIKGDDDRLPRTLAQHVANPARTGAHRAVLDKDADPVRPCALDYLREIEGLVGLAHDRLGAGLPVGEVGRVAAAGVEPHPGDRGDIASMDAEPRIPKRVDLGNVRGHVVLELVAASRPETLAHGLDHTPTRLRVTRDDAVTRGVDDREVDALLVCDQLTHARDRRQQPPDGPVDLIGVRALVRPLLFSSRLSPGPPPPRPSDGIEAARELRGVEPAVVDLAPHFVHVGPGAERKERIALSRRVSDRRVRLEPEQSTCQLGVHLGETRRTPKTFLIRGRVALIVEHPAHRIGKAIETTRESISQLGQCGQKVLPHAVVCGARRGEDECEIAADRLGTEVNALSRRCAIADVRARPLAAVLQRLFVTRDQNQPRGHRWLRGFVPGRRCSPLVERLQDLCRIAAFEDVKLRRRTLRTGSGFDVLAEVPWRSSRTQAIHRRNGDARRSRRTREPGPATRKCAMVNRQRSRGQMQEPRGRVSMPEAIGQAPDLATRAPLQPLVGGNGPAAHTCPLPLAFPVTFPLAFDDRVHTITIAHGIVEPFHQQRDRGVPRNW